MPRMVVEADVPNLSGRVCLITGGTSGIGAVTARALNRLGATVVVVGRNPERCAAVVEQLNRESGSDRASAITADLSLLEQTRGAAEAFRARHDRLDALINNVGALFLKRAETPEGLERTFALNHLSPFTITQALIEPLRRATPSRIVNVSSEAHRSIKAIDWDNLQGERSYRGFHAYSLSKLENLLFTLELSRRLDGTGITANALHPGFVRSSFFNGPGPAWWLLRRIADLFARDETRGAATSIHLAASPEVGSISGAYFIDRQQREPSPLALDQQAAQRLWTLSADLTDADAIPEPEPSRTHS